MNGVTLFLFFACFIYVIAMSSIGKECYDKNPDFKNKHPDNNEYLSWGVGLSVVGLVICIILIVLKVLGKID
jgi:hypothetical protein